MQVSDDLAFLLKTAEEPQPPKPQAMEVWLLLEYCNKGTLRVCHSITPTCCTPLCPCKLIHALKLILWCCLGPLIDWATQTFLQNVHVCSSRDIAMFSWQRIVLTPASVSTQQHVCDHTSTSIKHNSLVAPEKLCICMWQDGVDRGWFRTNRSAIHGLPDLMPILATAREIASGMAHLHSMNILHGDLTSLNILLASSDIDNRGFIAKVRSIFGSDLLWCHSCGLLCATRCSQAHPG